MDILEQIIETKRQELSFGKRRSLKQALLASETGIIAEFKRKSPSKGWIHADAFPEEVVPAYAAAGAAALSILTDAQYFGGSLDFIRRVRPLVDIPILRKDFIIDPYQLYQAREAGADAVLLIAACLSREACAALLAEAHRLGLEVLLEVHSPEELDYITPDVDVVGVNNRHLGSFVTDVKTSFKMIKRVIPAEEPESPSPASATPDEPSASTTSIASPSIADPAPSFDDLIGEPPARRKPHLSLRLHAASVNTVSAGSSTVNMGKRTEYYYGANIPDGVVSSPVTENSDFYSSDLSSNIINPVPVPRAPTIPISFGVSVELSLSRHWSLLSGLDYTQRSGYRVYERAPQSLTLHYLGLPFEAHYIFWPEGRFRVYLGAGAKVEKCFLATGGEPLKDPFLFSLNVQAGADVRLFPGIRLYLSPVFSGYLTRSAYVNSWDSKPQFSLRAGLSFDL